MTNMWAATVQEGTLLEATNRKQLWNREDLEYVVQHTDFETDEQLALATGRTLYAIWSIQHRIAAGELTMESIAEQFAPKPVIVRDMCPGCFTELSPAGACIGFC